MNKKKKKKAVDNAWISIQTWWKCNPVTSEGQNYVDYKHQEEYQRNSAKQQTQFSKEISLKMLDNDQPHITMHSYTKLINWIEVSWW